MPGKRTCGRAPRLTVRFVTGYAEQAAARTAFLGARMHMITKPFVLDELGELARNIIEGSSQKTEFKVR